MSLGTQREAGAAVQSAPLMPVRPRGLIPGLSSTDHKRIGLNVIVCSLLFFIVGGFLALVMRTQLAAPDNHVVSDQVYTELFTMHGSTMIYLFVSPLAIGMGMYLVPLQIGAPAVSGSRLALTGFWTWLLGGLTMQSGWLVSGGPGRDGWFSYTPLSESQFTPGLGQSLWVLGVILAAGGMLAMAACVLATIARRRAPGMALLRMPVFTWTSVVTVLMVVGSFPVLMVAMILLYLDRTTGGHVFYGFDGAIAWQDLFWFFGHPVVYVMFFPFLGAAAEAIAVGAHKRWFGYKPFVASMMLFSALSMSVWAHHMFVTGGSFNEVFAFTSTMLIVPAGIEYFDMAGTLIGGSITLRASLLFGVTFFLQFLIGGLTGIMTASPVLDYNFNDSYFVIGHFHYTLFAGSVFGLFAGVYHWFPKVTGAYLREGLGKLQLAVMIVGTNATFFPMFIVGQDGMPRRISRYPGHSSWQLPNLIETIGAYIIALGILIFIYNLWVSLRHRVPAPGDPWEGHSLEWWTTSPPPPLNFEAPLPPIRSYAPLKDLRETPEEREHEEAPL